MSPANHHSTNFSIIIIIRDWHNRPTDGRSAEWTHLDSTLHSINEANINITFSRVLMTIDGVWIGNWIH
jgi:hypothetical protein